MPLPSRDVLLSVRIPAKMKVALKRLADADQRTLSALVLIVLDRYISASQADHVVAKPGNAERRRAHYAERSVVSSHARSDPKNRD